MTREHINKKSSCDRLMSKPIYPFCIFITIILTFFLNPFLGNLAYAQKQGQDRIDSLLTELPRIKEGITKVNLLNNLCWEYYSIGNYEAGLQHAIQAQTIAKNRL